VNIEKFYSAAKLFAQEIERNRHTISTFIDKFNVYMENLKRSQKSSLWKEISNPYLLFEEYLHELSFKIVNYRYSIFSELKFIPEYTIQSLLNKINITKRNNVYYRPESCKEMLSGLAELENSLSTIQGYLNTTINNFKYFNIHEDVVGADECELSIIIPRNHVENNLSNLGKELIEFEKNLSVFSEIATGSRTPIQVRSIASSDFSIFLDSVPAIGALIAVTVERIIALYKSSLEIKKLKLELEKHQVPDEIAKLLDQHISSIVSKEAEKIAAELMEKHAAHIDEGRKNELLTELRHSVENLADKIDKGFQIEVRVAELDNEKKESGGELTEQEIAIKQITESAKKISYPISSEEPVLSLSEKGKEE
jgi:hypothetical protein